MNFTSNPANCRKSGPSGSGRPRSATSRAARAIALPATWNSSPRLVGGSSPERDSSPMARSIPSSRRSEEHTSELQSQSNLVCRLLLEKKKKNNGQREIREDSMTVYDRGATGNRYER